MKVITTESEIQQYVDFEDWLRKNPCRDGKCLDVEACLGCELHKEWKNRRPSNMTGEEYTHSGLLHDLAVAQHDYAEAVREKETAEERLNKARQKFDEIRSKIVVE